MAETLPERHYPPPRRKTLFRGEDNRVTTLLFSDQLVDPLKLIFIEQILIGGLLALKHRCMKFKYIIEQYTINE